MSAGPSVSGLHAVVLLAQGRTDGVALLRSEPSDVTRSFFAMAVAVPAQADCVAQLELPEVVVLLKQRCLYMLLLAIP